MNPTQQKTPEQVERRAHFLQAKVAKAQKELDLLPTASSSMTLKAGELEPLNILIGCPAYGGAVQHIFVSSLIALSQTLVNFGIHHQIKFLGNQSIVGIARDHSRTGSTKS